MTVFTRDQIREQLRAKNVGEAAIARVLAREFGEEAPAKAAPSVPLKFACALTLPWSALVSDNRKYSPSCSAGSRNGRLILRPEYREAKGKAKQLAVRVMGGMAPIAAPLELHARVWVPDNRPGHDVANFAKCAHDAFEGVIYSKDEWLHCVTWERVGVDVDAPRAEILISLLP